ncbi:MAG: PDZ domain-containing protein [Bacteroidales bacterium]|nr:PDZ domain-containing protein [Bacteroidales bacterium]
MEHKNTRLAIWLPLVLALMLATGVFIGNSLKNNTVSQMPLKVFTTSDKISTILNYIQQNYVDPVNRDSLTEEIIRPLLEKLDPHSFYISAKDLQAINENLRGNFDGIGVQFNMIDDTVMVIQPVKGGPSEQAGILAGDRIVTVDGDTIAGVHMPQDSIVARLKGPRGSKVVVGIHRKGVPELLDFEITRGIIPLVSVDVSYMIDDSTGFIKISTFSQSTYKEFTEHLQQLKEAGCRNLIIDLRGNPGGIMEPAIDIADEFLEKEKLIVYTQGRARKRIDYKATSKNLGQDLSLAVLIDEGSASASEILAGALQDNDRAWIIGRRSFGKGLVQEQTQLGDGSALRLTTARYYTPTGRSIQKPYNHGLNQYYMDIASRFKHGEFITADSIHFNDSLKYTTPGGRTVYGGGGIMPDYFVPYDTTGITPLFIQLNRGGLIYRYALLYVDQYREMLDTLKTAREIDSTLERQDAADAFLTYIRQKGFHPSKNEWKSSFLIINTQLKAYIARNLIDNPGFYPIIQTIDQTLNRAVRFLETQ